MKVKISKAVSGDPRSLYPSVRSRSQADSVSLCGPSERIPLPSVFKPVKTDSRWLGFFILHLSPCLKSAWVCVVSTTMALGKVSGSQRWMPVNCLTWQQGRVRCDTSVILTWGDFLGFPNGRQTRQNQCVRGCERAGPPSLALKRGAGHKFKNAGSFQRPKKASFCPRAGTQPHPPTSDSDNWECEMVVCAVSGRYIWGHLFWTR